MRVLAISHERNAGPGVFADAIASAGDELDVWHLAEDPLAPSDLSGYGAVMTFGGAMHVDQRDRHAWISPEVELLARLLDDGVPLLGVCLGAQLLTVAAGGGVRPAREPEIGWYPVRLTADGHDDPLLAPLAGGFEAFQWHSYECLPPPGAAVLATSEVCGQAFRLGERAWAIQFHAEVAGSDAAEWIDDYDSDPDAVRIGVDPAQLGPATARQMPTWNELGRALCARFLEVAAPVDAPVRRK